MKSYHIKVWLHDFDLPQKERCFLNHHYSSEDKTVNPPVVAYTHPVTITPCGISKVDLLKKLF